jgi:hypothetical protein
VCDGGGAEPNPCSIIMRVPPSVVCLVAVSFEMTVEEKQCGAWETNSEEGKRQPREKTAKKNSKKINHDDRWSKAKVGWENDAEW